MKKLLLFYVILISSTFGTSVAQILSLSGNDWKIKDIPNDSAEAFCSNWIPAKVPGNIQADLETARILKPLWYGAGDKRLYDVPKNGWCYRKEFAVPAEFSSKRIRLVFDGVDNYCDVWLNGHKIGSNPDMFRRFEFDVADVLKIGETNRLDVVLANIPAESAHFIEKSDGRESGARTEWFFVDGISKTLETLKDLKSPTNFGWDWGVNIWTLGIWKDVRLEASGRAVIDYLKIETPLSDNYRKAKIQVNVVVNSKGTDAGTLKLKISGNGIERSVDIPYSLRDGLNKLYGEIPLENPALWWPNGHGEQKLYDLDAALLDGSGNVLHTKHSRFGVREVRWQLTAEAPADFKEKYMPIVNGRAIRMIGSNLIPPDLLFARIPERAPHLLRLAKESGYTVLRFWGGGVILTPEMYDLADRLGIMLVLEMPIASLDPKPDPDFLKNIDTTLRNIIRQVWNHPSIIEYTGGNEMRWGHLSGGDLATLSYIRQIFAKEDPGRVFRDTDPVAGGAHGPWNYPVKLKNPLDPIGVYTEWNYLIPRVPDNSGMMPTGPTSYLYPIMRHGEFGFQTPAHLEVWQRDIPPSDQWPVNKENPVMIRKNVTYAVFDGDAWLEKPVIDYLFGESPDVEFLLKAGQYIGAEGLRYELDAIRRRGAAAGGMMTWDFNEPWTNGAGSYQVDYDGRPLLNNTFVRQAVSQLSLSLRYPSSLYTIPEGIRASLYLSGDADVPVTGLTWSWKARDRRGKVISSGKGKVGINPIEVKKLAELSIKLPEKTAFGPVLVELQLCDAQGKVLNERVHIFGLAGVTAPLKGLLNQDIPDLDDDIKMLEQLSDTTKKGYVKDRLLPGTSRPIKRTNLKVETRVPKPEGDDEVLEMLLTNEGEMTALFCEPKPMLNYRTDLIIDNLYVCIPPHESRTIQIRAPHYPKDGLTLNQTGWRIESWNANTVEILPSADILLALGRQDRMCREFAGYPGLAPSIGEDRIQLTGRQANASKVPLLADDSNILEWAFQGTSLSVSQVALLSIHSSDQATTGAMISIDLNGKHFLTELPEGYGFQKTYPAHLAQTKSAEVVIPEGVIRQGDNLLRIKVTGSGWFTWDALSLRSGVKKD